jgi:hypothetical protein
MERGRSARTTHVARVTSLPHEPSHLPPNLRIAMTGDFQETMDCVLEEERKVSGASEEVILAAARKLFEEGI